ncbi:MAG: pyridoxamine 5'-phosphate oxidase family protein [Rhodocyclaceae bacterium]|nr:pyridoxamine 5'-phosphate oxidase family protein [Rhodocyclaceae bacterium]MDP2194833.1 pyridoxamine 5'-phosphate oxidase family protein [Rhodocyclaceae bacterium]
MPTSTAPSSRTRVRRMPERAQYDADAINSIVDSAFICSVAFQIDGVLHAIPTIHWREGNHLYIHGAKASRMFKALTEGEACITIALADGLVLARSAMHHSVNYRSVVIYGRFELVTDPVEKQHRLQAFIDGLYPGRWSTLRPVNEKELNATSLLRIPLTEASAKVRNWGVKDDEDDLGWPVWAGVIPLSTVIGTPQTEKDSVVHTAPQTRFGPAGS